MKFDQLVNRLISESAGDVISLVPGSFKPPHKGHYRMIEYFASKSSRCIVIVSDPKNEKSIRRTEGGKKITAQEAQSILEIYLQNLSNVEIVVTNQPIKWVFDFVAEDTTPGEKIILGVSGKGNDHLRYKNIEKYTPEGVSTEVFVFSDSDLNINASDFRKIIDNPTIGTINHFLPDHLSDDQKENVLEILGNIRESV